jgi:F0F1-type ATP synthase membrane subunit a
MESYNLNTMNSYFVPNSLLPKNSDWDVDLADYVHIAKDIKNPQAVLSNANTDSNASSVIHLMSSYIGIWLQIGFFFFLWWMLVKKKESTFTQTIMLAYETMYETFEDLIWNDKPTWMKQFITHLFFIILFANAMWWINDMIRFFFPFWLRNVTWATGELEFNVALALMATLVILFVQWKQVGWWLKLLHEYIPITGKWLMDNKIGDIVISMFIGLLDIIGVFARIISLSLRLFGNMSAWSILLNVAYLWLWAVTVWFLSTNIALWLPLIVYLQWILSVVVQAFVFSLIVWISLKMVSE